MRITKYDTQLGEDGLAYLVKEQAKNSPVSFAFDNPRDIAKFSREVLNIHKKTEEYVYLLCLASSLKLIGYFELSHGSIDYSICNPREIFLKALLCNSKNIILIHNHPGQNQTPSKMDIEVAKKILSYGKDFGIYMVDSIIVTRDSYASIRELGCL